MSKLVLSSWGLCFLAQSAHAQETSASTDAAVSVNSGDTQSGEVEESPPQDPGSESSIDEASPAAEAESSEGVVEGGGLFESASSGSDSSVEADALSLEWGGYVRGDVFVGKDEATGDAGINAAYGEVSLQPRVKTGTWGGAFADLRVRYGQQLEVKDLFIDIREAYASAYLGPVELRLGKQIVVWGRADGFNPTNNLSAVDFRIRSPIEDDRRIGNIAARGFLTFNPIRIEAVWMPLYEPTMYPNFTIDDGVTSFVDPLYPTMSMKDGLYAGKVHLELSSFDGSISYLYGNAPLPGIDLESFAVGSVGADNPQNAYVNVRRRSYQQHVIGADFATTVSDWFGVRGEAAFRSPVDYKNRPWAAKPDAQWVLGLDREFGPVSVIAQYLGRYTFDWEAKHPVDTRGTGGLLLLDPYNQADVQQGRDAIMNTLFNTNQMLFSQLYELQSLASLRLEWKTLHDTLSISALTLYNFNTQEFLITPKIAYNITGGLTAYVGAEIFHGKRKIYNGDGADDLEVEGKNINPGDPGTLFGLIDQKLTAGYAELRASF